MNLLDYANNNDSQENQKFRQIFKSKHIIVYENEKSYQITCFDKIGLDAMHTCFQISPAKYMIAHTTDEIREFYAKSVEDNQEGIMIKEIDKEYRAGKKIGFMYKMKPTSEDIDVVIVAAQKGKGKRGGFFSSFFVAVQDNKGELKTIGKVGSGVREEEESELSMQYLSQLLLPLKIREDEKEEITYFKPEIIIQVSYQDLQESQTTQSNYALRFPKIVALRTTDKSLTEITTLEEVLQQHNLDN